MGMPNIPPNIESQIDVDRDDVINLFFEGIKSNKENIRKFFENDKELIDILRKSNINLNQKQFIKIKNSLADIRKILKEKGDVEKEIKKYINTLINNKASYFQFHNIIYILFIILSTICLKPNNRTCYNSKRNYFGSFKNVGK